MTKLMPKTFLLVCARALLLIAAATIVGCMQSGWRPALAADNDNRSGQDALGGTKRAEVQKGAIDAKRGLLYVGTGESTSEPAAPTTDAILAIDLKDGSLRWTFQATENDIFLSGCGRNRKGLNCPKETVFRDVDFGASVIIATRADGKDVLLAGQKAGTLWALDPDSGKLVWRQDFGEGSPLGGIHWGIASDGERVFAPINRPYGFTPPKDGGAIQKPGIHGLKIDTGEVLAREIEHRAQLGMKVVAFLDDDAQAGSDWLERMLAWYDDPSIIGVGGASEPVWRNGRPGWFPVEFDWVVGGT